MRYHLGCGSIYIEGYHNVDFPPENHIVNKNIRVDQYANILTMKMQQCSEIRSSHVFEHFNYMDSLYLLYKWYNVLSIGGTLRICLPDVEALALELNNASVEKSFRIIRYLYGSHEDHWAYHVNGWTKKTLPYVLEKIGFKIVQVNQFGSRDSEYPNCSLEIFAEKSTNKNKENIKEIILSLFMLYKNGDTEFESSLEKHFQNNFLNRLKLDND